MKSGDSDSEADFVMTDHKVSPDPEMFFVFMFLKALAIWMNTHFFKSQMVGKNKTKSFLEMYFQNYNYSMTFTRNFRRIFRTVLYWSGSHEISFKWSSWKNFRKNIECDFREQVHRCGFGERICCLYDSQ